MTKSRGGKKRVNSNSLKLQQKCVKHNFLQNCFLIFLLRCFTWYRHCPDLLFKWLFHFKRYADAISMKFLSFTIIDSNLAENLTNLAEIVGPRVVYGVAFSNSKDPWSWWGQVATKCQVEWWSGLSRESRGSRPCCTLSLMGYIRKINRKIWKTVEII